MQVYKEIANFHNVPAWRNSVDATDLKSVVRMGVPVRVWQQAPQKLSFLMSDQIGFNFFASNQPTQRQISDEILAKYNKERGRLEEAKRWGCRLSMCIDASSTQSQAVYLLRSALYQLEKSSSQKNNTQEKKSYCQTLSLEASFKRGRIDPVSAVRKSFLSLQKR